MEIIFGANDGERYKADQLDEALVCGKRHAFTMNNDDVFEAEYDWMTVDGEGFIIFVNDVVTSVEWCEEGMTLILDVRDIVRVKEL